MSSAEWTIASVLKKCFAPGAILRPELGAAVDRGGEVKEGNANGTWKAITAKR
jgi:hypothetical protein